MKINPPKKITFWISVIIVVLGLLGKLVTIPFLSDYSFWVVLIGYVLLFLALLIKGL